jgi:preprotein translocase subunit SecG
MEAIGNVIIVIHLMVVIALVAVVLLQRSEGGALGIGGSNAFLSSRGQGNVLTRATGILAAVFFATSIAMTVIARMTAPPSAILDQVPAAATTAPATNGTTAPATGGVKNELDRFLQGAGGTTTTTPPADTTTAPATGGTTGTGTSGSATTPPAGATTEPAAPQAPTSQ